MAYHVLPRRLKQLGYCCPMEYFEARTSYSTSQIALELKLHLRTARNWRAKFRNDKLCCTQSLSCFQKTPDRCLDSTASDVEGLDSVPTSESFSDHS